MTPMLSILVPDGLSADEQAAHIRAEMVKIGLDPALHYDAFVVRDAWRDESGERIKADLNGNILGASK